MNLFDGITNYFRSSMAELKKVSWPSRADTVRYSGLVIAVSVILAAFFTMLDFGLDKLLTAGLARKHVPVAQPAQPATPPVEVVPISATGQSASTTASPTQNTGGVLNFSGGQSIPITPQK